MHLQEDFINCAMLVLLQKGIITMEEVTDMFNTCQGMTYLDAVQKIQNEG